MFNLKLFGLCAVWICYSGGFDMCMCFGLGETSDVSAALSPSHPNTPKPFIKDSVSDRGCFTTYDGKLLV